LRLARVGLASLAALTLLAAVGAAADEAIPERSGPVATAQIDGTINPATSDYLQAAIREAERMDASVLIVALNTPGGLVASTRDIIQAMLASSVPIVVYVSPQGAWAGSAGTYITLAANVAAMAPGSSIGAAHPVGLGGSAPPPKTDAEGKASPPDYETQKAENMMAAFIESIAAKRKRNVKWAVKAVRESVAVTADQAKKIGVIDLIARNQADLLAQLEGRVVELDTGSVRLHVKGEPIHEIPMSIFNRVMSVIVDPNVAMLLLIGAALGLYVEMNHPGLVLPGAVGATCLVLALIAMQVLPFSWTGVLLMGTGLALFVAEAFVVSHGLLLVSGVVCLLLGGAMIFRRPDLSDLNVSFWTVLVPAVTGFALFGGLVVALVGRSMGRPQVAGTGEMVGMVGRATTALDPTGTVFIRGEYWRAEADEPIAADEAVEAVGVEGMLLRVRRARRGAPKTV
jgi:membrane-bound serine protease (ClpP class)